MTDKTFIFWGILGLIIFMVSCFLFDFAIVHYNYPAYAGDYENGFFFYLYFDIGFILIPCWIGCWTQTILCFRDRNISIMKTKNTETCDYCKSIEYGRVHCGKEKGHDGEHGEWCKRCCQ